MRLAVLSRFSNSSLSLSRGGIPRKFSTSLGPIRGTCFCSQHSGSLSQPDAPETSSTAVKKRIVSGVQPTGSIHLGNYFGAIKNWIALQNSYDALFIIADLHAITLPHDFKNFSKATRNTTAIYLACGVDTSKASVFIQSHVCAHSNMMWLLGSVSSVQRLSRMSRFKEKSRKMGDESVGLNLLAYPVLMAADILLYQPDFVPIVEDQKQHLKFIRDLANRMNNLYGESGENWKGFGSFDHSRGGAIFKIPEPLIPPVGAQVMSLTDGRSKMSKSAPFEESPINLLDPKDVIAKKIKQCKTDSFPGMEFDNPFRPECNNLLTIYQLVSGKTKEEVVHECQDMSWGSFQPLLTDALIDHLHPIQVGCEEIISDSSYLNSVLKEGAAKAKDIADVTCDNLYKAMGFYKI